MGDGGRLDRRTFMAGGVGAAALVAIGGRTSMLGATASAAQAVADAPDFGPNVLILDPSMSAGDIQTQADAIDALQQKSQFGTGRYTLLFMPGTYDVSFDIGYYTSVAGLGLSPDDVTFNGTVNATATGNGSDTTFWRSLENVHVIPQAGQTPMWACAQACPIRRVHLGGSTQLWLVDFQNGFASGGFIADSLIEPLVFSGGQQQYLTRDSILSGGWSNGNWNQVFSGVTGAPPQSFPNPPYTTLPTSPVTREKPFLHVDDNGSFHVFVPALRRNSAGATWAQPSGAHGRSVPITQFFIAQPTDDAETINLALAHGKHLILTPGIYSLDQPLVVTRPNTIVLGLGFPTLVPANGTAALLVDDVPGVKLAGLLVDAGPVNSDVLVQVGAPSAPKPGPSGNSVNPISVQDVFFRIGGATLGQATTTLEINADYVIIDNVWAWRADHGTGVGWTQNTADTGLIVNGNNVIGYGLFVEHYQSYEIIWNGEGGTVIFLQNEMPYDPPDQASWMENATTNGYPAFLLSPVVRKFRGYGMGSYCFFHNHAISAYHAFEVPDTPGVQFRDILTFGGTGTIDHVINDTGALATGDQLSDVVAYP